MKKLITLFLAVALILAFALPVCAYSAPEKSGYIEIGNLTDLEQIADNPAGKYILTSDITAGEWSPVGTADKPFTGVFDGNGYTISGLDIDLTGADLTCGGMFGVVKGTVKNLNLKDIGLNYVFNDNKESDVGGIAGLVDGGTIFNCSVTGNITASGYQLHAGIIAGENKGGIVNQCCGNATLSASAIKGEFKEIYAGGICGLNAGEINNCCLESKGSVTASQGSGTVPSVISAGGVAGFNTENGKIYGSYSNYGKVTADGWQAEASGIAKNDGEISISYFTGEVLASAPNGDAVAGGISSINNGTISDSNNADKVKASAKGEAVAGGIAAYNAGTVKECYNVGDIDATLAGGIVYSNESGAEITNCYYLDGDASQPSVVASEDVSSVAAVTTYGTPLTDDKMKVLDNYEGFSKDTWFVNSGDHNYLYPQFKLKAVELSEKTWFMDKDGKPLNIKVLEIPAGSTKDQSVLVSDSGVVKVGESTDNLYPVTPQIAGTALLTGSMNDDYGTFSNTCSVTVFGNTYHVFYNKNTTDTVTGMPLDNTNYLANEAFTVLGNGKFVNNNTATLAESITDGTPTRSGYIFKGWSLANNSSVVDFTPGAVKVISGDITLYAVWAADGKTVNSNNNKTVVNNTKKSPQTGEENNLVIYLVMAVLCLTGIAYFAARNARRKQK